MLEICEVQVVGMFHFQYCLGDYEWIKTKINTSCNALRYFIIIMLIIQGCETGTYGESCSKKCNQCKNNATCGIQYGECDGSGCIGLYKPPLCKGKYMTCKSGTKGHILNLD